MLIKIAWKNIWRNPIRSLVVIVSVLLGLWAGLFMIAFGNGLNEQRMTDQLNTTQGHLKMGDPRFSEEKLIRYTVDQPQEMMEKLEKNPAITGISPRVNTLGMASSASGSFGVDIYGVNPEKEKKVLTLYKHITRGKYLEGIRKNPVVIGEKLAKRLKLKLRSRMVLQFQDMEGEIVAGAFRVTGIYHLSNARFEESHVFVRDKDLQRLIGNKTAIHQIIGKTRDFRDASAIVQPLKGRFGKNQIQSWEEVAPDLAYMDGMMMIAFFIFMSIILLALSMGIINTMLMAVLERSRELGMLMSIGMTKKRIFGMIMIETFFLACTGLPVGLFLSWLSVYITFQTGIDLSAVGQGFEAMGYSSFIRPSLTLREYAYVCLMVFVAALFSAIYPAWKALQLNPAQAIRKI